MPYCGSGPLPRSRLPPEVRWRRTDAATPASRAHSSRPSADCDYPDWPELRGTVCAGTWRDDGDQDHPIPERAMSARDGSKGALRQEKLKRTAQTLGVSEDLVHDLRRRHGEAVKDARNYPKSERDDRVAAFLGLTRTQLRTFRRSEAAPLQPQRAQRRRVARVVGPLGPIPPPQTRGPKPRLASAPAEARGKAAAIRRRSSQPAIEVCQSCGRPIKSTGKCGCL